MGRNFDDILIITDMDGTFLDDNRNIPEKNLEAKHKFENHGGLFTIATGRTTESIDKYLHLINPKLPLILFNGALIYDFNTKKALWKATINPSVREDLKRILKQFPQVGAEVIMEDKIYMIQTNDYSIDHVTRERLEYIECDLDDLDDGWYKVLFALDPKLMDEFISFIQSQKINGVSFVRSEKHYYEILPIEANKGNALLKLIEIIGIDRENVVAIGDYNNDIEMVQLAKLGFATENATRDLHKVADKITTTNNAGAVAEVIEFVILNKDNF